MMTEIIIAILLIPLGVAVIVALLALGIIGAVTMIPVVLVAWLSAFLSDVVMLRKEEYDNHQDDSADN